jgi:hypothetical protein
VVSALTLAVHSVVSVAILGRARVPLLAVITELLLRWFSLLPRELGTSPIRSPGSCVLVQVSISSCCDHVWHQLHSLLSVSIPALGVCVCSLC